MAKIIANAITDYAEEWAGMNFREWCALDENDERKIHYSLWSDKNATSVEKFTSEDNVNWSM